MRYNDYATRQHLLLCFHVITSFLTASKEATPAGFLAGVFLFLKTK